MKLNQKGFIDPVSGAVIFALIIGGLVGYSEGKKNEKVVEKEKVVIQVKEVQKDCPTAPIQYPTKPWWKF